MAIAITMPMTCILYFQVTLLSWSYWPDNSCNCNFKSALNVLLPTAHTWPLQVCIMSVNGTILHHVA